MTTQATSTIIEHVVGCLAAADYASLTERFAPDALLDMNLPAWRFQLQGPRAIKQHFTEQTEGLEGLRCTQVRELVRADVIVVESEYRFDRTDGEYLWRAVDLFQILSDEIVEHIQYCSGCWSPADVARHSVEAPMVRW